MGWVEVNPSVDGNLFRASGGQNRFGIQERDEVSDPVSLTENTFDAALLLGAGTSVFYSDYRANTRTGIPRSKR